MASHFLVQEQQRVTLSYLFQRSLPLLDPGEPGIVEEQYHTAASLIGQLDAWEIHVQGATDNGFAGERGSVLVFLPGKDCPHAHHKLGRGGGWNS